MYCEKEMSNTIEGARNMVLAARKSGKLLQIGHQRRSHPRYLHCYNNLLQEANILGRIVTINGQWNRGMAPDLGWPGRYTIEESKLKQFGFESMPQFRNWRVAFSDVAPEASCPRNPLSSANRSTFSYSSSG